MSQFPLFVFIGLFWSSLSFGAAFIRHQSSYLRSSTSPAILFAFDYEYIPPNPGADPSCGSDDDFTALSSSYPPGTPAALRGEAVRSALLSGRCIGWDLSSSSTSSGGGGGEEESLSMGGILKIQGKGMKDFLNNKLTRTFISNDDDSQQSYQEACLLDAKGRVVDRLRLCIHDDTTAYVLTSPGHTSEKLLKRLDPFIFPLDQVTLTNLDESFIFTLCSIQRDHVEQVIKQQLLPDKNDLTFPSRPNEYVQWKIDDTTSVLVIPSTGLPSVACVGYTLIFYGDESDDSSAKSRGTQLWQYLISDANPKGPIEVGALEYESLRIQAGQPSYGKEIGNDAAKTSPLELHWEDLVDLDKGCYLGQEGIASIWKNPRGPPRTLYSVEFSHESNIYESQSQGDRSDVENLTRPPKPGQKLYALGSNEELLVGTLTSVAEAGGTGDASIVALAMVRRADSIMKKMKELDLEIFREPQDFIDVTETSGLIEPPPLDPLDGLEVIVQGTFTVGTLKMVPTRRLRTGQNMFDTKIEVEDFQEPPISIAYNSPPMQIEDEEDLLQIQAEVERAAAEAEAAAAEAQRKAEKMEMLRKRAEEAMAKRKKKREQE